MTVLPIVARELRVASRRRGTYWNRAVNAALALVIFSWIFLVARGAPTAQLSLILFWSMAFCFFWVAMSAGLLYTADSLSSEKREGTLGLLFLTRLKGWDVVGGKLVVTSLSGCYGLLAVVPILAIPLLMGGITLPEFGRVTLVLVNTLFFSLAAGVTASALVRRARTATAVTLLILLLANGLGPALGTMVSLHTEARASQLFFIPSAGFAGITAPATSYQVMPGAFWVSVALIHAEAWILLAVASFVVRRSWQERPLKQSGLGIQASWRRVLYGNSASRSQLRQRLLDRNPCLWLSGRHRYRPWVVWAMLLVVGLAWGYGYAKIGAEWVSVPVFILTALVLHLLLLMWVTSEAVSALGPDLRSGALELVLSTSIGVRALLWGHWLGLLRQFLGPAMFVVLVDLIMMAFGLFNASGFGLDSNDARAVWCLVWFMALGAFLFSLVTLAWLGMWQGVKQRQLNRASGNCVTIVIVLPWVLLGLMTTFLGMARALPPLNGPGAFLIGYALTQVTVNTLALLWARDRLVGGLRGRVARRYGERQTSPGTAPA